MIATWHLNSVERQRVIQRRVNVVAATVLLLCTLAFGGLLARPLLPGMSLLVLLFISAVLGVLLVWRRPAVSLYALVSTGLIIEQFPITGIETITTRAYLFWWQLSAFTPLPLPISTAEMLMVVTLAAVLLPALAKHGPPFRKGGLFAPLMIFLAAVFASYAYGAVSGSGGGAFDWKVGLREVIGFVYLGTTYVLACNLITDRRQLHSFIWIVITALSFKGIQGVLTFLDVRQRGLDLEAITGHEDTLFFSSLFVLFASMVLYGGPRRQRVVMLCSLPFLALTMLATERRIGFIILAAGMLVLGVSLIKVRRDLFFKIAPIVTILLVSYTAAFWNATDTVLGQPVRAFRTQFEEVNERDRLSNQWRDIEKVNIAYNIKNAELTGLGFGRPYTFLLPQPSLDDTGFTLWRYVTHNAIFWVWMKMGTIGFIVFWFLLGSAIVQGLLIFRRLSDGHLKAIALFVVSLIVMNIFFAYGDLGLTYARTMTYLGTMLGLLMVLPTIDEQTDTQTARVPW